MKKLVSVLGLALAAAFALAQAPAATRTPDHHDRGPDDIFRLKPLLGGVYALYGRGGNVGFFVGSDVVLVVDSQFKDIAPGIVEQIKKVTDKPIKFLLNTHHHGDHVGGNEIFRQFALIVAHDNVRKRMLASPVDILRDYPARLEDAKKTGNADMAKFLADQIEWAKKAKVEDIAAPVMTFDSELKIYIGGETINLWHAPPAHTDGDSVAYFEKAKVVHMGDLLFNRVIPFIDVQSGGSVRGYIAALDKILARIPADAAIIPGHGEVTDVAGIQAMRQYISDLLDAAASARKAGKSKDDFVKTVDLPAYKDYAGYKDRFKTNCASAYDEVAAR